MNGFDALGNVLQSRMRDVNTQNKDLSPSLGTVGASLSIVVDGDNWQIPKGAYMISSRLNIPATITSSASEGHHHIVTTGVSPIKAGDRVLIVWVGKEPVVVDIVRSS